MVTVAIYRVQGRITGYNIRGHAGYRPRGEDIVCAAVSMLAQTTVLGLARYINGLAYNVDESGVLRCSLPEGLNETQLIQADAILETMTAGLRNLQRDYSQYIRVFKRRWTSC